MEINFFVNTANKKHNVKNVGGLVFANTAKENGFTHFYNIRNFVLCIGKYHRFSDMA